MMKVETHWRRDEGGPELEVRVVDDETGRVLSRALCCLPEPRDEDDDDDRDFSAIERELVATALRRARSG